MSKGKKMGGGAASGCYFIRIRISTGADWLLSILLLLLLRLWLLCFYILWTIAVLFYPPLVTILSVCLFLLGNRFSLKFHVGFPRKRQEETTKNSFVLLLLMKVETSIGQEFKSYFRRQAVHSCSMESEANRPISRIIIPWGLRLFYCLLNDFCILNGATIQTFHETTANFPWD